MLQLDLDVLLHSNDGAISRAMSVGVLVVGCGHSGTSTVAKWLRKHNYRINPLNSYSWITEDINLIKFNDEVRKQFNTTEWSHWIDLMIESAKGIDTFVAEPAMVEAGAATISQNITVKKWLDLHPRPFILKDPNFVFTLSFWTSLFEQLGEGLPLLIHVTRERSAMLDSYAKRHEQISPAQLEMKIKWEDWQLEQWPGAAVSFPIEALVHAESANKFTKMSKQPKQRLEKWKALVRVR